MKEPVAQKSKILIVDDHPVVREGLEAVIALQPDFHVEGGAGSATEAYDLITRLHPDVVIVDINLPGRNGIELIKDIRKISPKTRMLVYSMHEAAIYAERAYNAGALGFVMKEEGAAKVVEGIREILAGHRFLCPELPPESANAKPKGKSVDPDMLPMNNLSDRQLEIFELVGSGLNSQEIGEKLSLSPKTVNAHKMNIQDRIGLHSARELLMAATRWMDRH